MATKERLTKFVRALRNWGILGDVRSAIVGSCFGAVVGLLAAALAEQPGKEIIIETNEDGYAQPMNTLLREMNKVKSEINITFEPPNLQNVYVCEYVRINGYTYRDVFLTYLNKYSMCFMPIENQRINSLFGQTRIRILLSKKPEIGYVSVIHQDNAGSIKCSVSKRRVVSWHPPYGGWRAEARPTPPPPAASPGAPGGSG